MKKFALGFLTGLLAITFVLAIYSAHLLIAAQPGFQAIGTSENLTKDQKKEVALSLIRLSEVSNLVGLDRYAALFGGSAGIIGAEAGMSPVETRYALTRAMILTKKYGVDSGNFNPYLETAFSSALLFKDQGELTDAKKTVHEAITFANLNSPGSYWIKNLETLQKRL